MRLKAIIIPLLFTTCISSAKVLPSKDTPSNKGKIYFFWGWNNGWYTNSDIYFQGDNYDFKLDDVKATDRQTPFDFKTYFSPSTLSIPQTNQRIGYYITNNIDLSIGVDHMKYVMVRDQTTKITGYIKNETIYDGVYSADEIVTTQDFLEFEHTDGLNYLNVEITKNENLLQALKIPSSSNKFKLNYIVGFGLGAMMPKSNVTLMNNNRNDEFHFAGYAFAAKTGINLTLFKYFYLRSELKGGFTHLTDIKTTLFDSDRARQHFFFGQLNFMFGFSINVFN